MKICFWGDISGALAGQTIGGSELQTALVAKALAKAGHEVVIVDTSSQEDYVTSEGIKIFRIKGWNSGIRYIRLFTHRMPGLYKGLKDQKADVYYCRMRDFTHIFSYLAARKSHGKFILAMASDLDALGFKMRFKYYYIPNSGGLWWLFNALIVESIYPLMRRNADLICVQHEGQREFLKERNIKSVLCNNLIDIDKLPAVTNASHDYFIHVGALDRRKGFIQFYNIVVNSPQHIFKIVGQPRDKTAERYFEKIKTFKNVILCGRLSQSETIIQIANSKALISTSMMEGFPNIFIEAWAYGIPVLSLNFDPGGVIEKEGLGAVANGNTEVLLKAMNEIVNTDEFAVRAKNYVCRNHILNDKKIKEIERLFTNI